MPEQSDIEFHLEGVGEYPPPEAFVEGSAFSDPQVYDRAAADPEAWWESWAEKLDWIERWRRVLDWDDPPHARWFEGGRLNASANCLDRHVEAGLGDRVAFLWEPERVGPDGDRRREVTYSELLDTTCRLANSLKSLGIGRGDVVGIYMPMVPETAAAMLACARIGAIHNVVFGGFSPESLADRMEFSEAKALITADASRRRGEPVPMKAAIDPVLDRLDRMESVIVLDRCGTDPPMKEGRDHHWSDLIETAEPTCPVESMDSEDPLFILYTSGSTARPKGVLHTTGGYLTQASATHRMVFDLREDDIYWCSADVGWVTGHSYIVYGPLANGATSVMYEGAPDFPERDRWWEIIARYGVTILYTAPTAIRTFMKWGDELPAGHDLSSLRLLGSVGEPINPEAWLWYRDVIGGGRCPVVDTWWQTETGGIMISPLPAITVTKPGSATVPLPGISAAILDEEGRSIGAGKGGNLVIDRPWPGMARSLYREPERFVETYWTRFGRATYQVGDAAFRDEDGYYWIVGRLDDVINVSGHRLSTMEVEAAIDSHPSVAEAAVIGIDDEHTGQALVAFVIPKDGSESGDGLTSGIEEHVADRIGKLARPSAIYYADDLPKTRSGKIMRRLLRDLASGNELGDTTTLRDPEIVEDLKEQVERSR
ncbi:MAG: acetate--CoA ligase [Solirubrobacterales bacterium]